MEKNMEMEKRRMKRNRLKERKGGANGKSKIEKESRGI